MFIRELTKDVTTLKGVGKQIALSYQNLGISSFADLLLLSPRSYEDRQIIRPLGAIADGEYANTIVEVVNHSYFGSRGKRTLKITITDISGEGDGRASLLCFGRNFLERTLRVGSHFYLYGQFQRNFHELQSSQFEMLPLNVDGSMPSLFGSLVPIYPLSGILSQRIIRRDVSAVLSEIPLLDEELPSSFIEKHQLLGTNEALRALHRPTSVEHAALAQRTFAYHELFYLLLLSRRKRKKSSMPTLKREFSFSPLQKKFIESLPFSLTKDQQSVLREICNNLDAPETMNRLLQGDVGS
ncbi:MAG: DNA helicase RecG, partial [Sphaerochaetaceae bacterium]